MLLLRIYNDCNRASESGSGIGDSAISLFLSTRIVLIKKYNDSGDENKTVLEVNWKSRPLKISSFIPIFARPS